MTAKNRKTDSVAKPDYRPTEEERAALSRLVNKRAQLASRVKVSEDGERVTISIGRALFMEALGTSDESFLDGFLGQIGNVASRGAKLNEQGFNFVLSVVKGIEPRDQVESMLAAQMAAVHIATMTFARRLAHVENIAQQDSAERALNKLARTFATQMEALKRYRTGGEQKVTVQHVTVSEGGQAIVGNVTQGQREATTDKPDSQPLLSDAKLASMPITDERKRRAPDPAPRTSKKK
jgi:hypothetical protein